MTTFKFRHHSTALPTSPSPSLVPSMPIIGSLLTGSPSSVTDILTASWCTSHLTGCSFSLMSPVDALSNNPFSPMADELLDGLPTGPLSAITDVCLDTLSFFAIPTGPPSWDCPSDPSKLFPFLVPFSLGLPPLTRTPLESSVRVSRNYHNS